MDRPSRHEWFLRIAEVVAQRSTCVRRHVGCVLVDKRNRIIATGHNGVPAGWNHCNEGYPCTGADSPSGYALRECLSIHAEQNAMMLCSDSFKIATCYSTCTPCTYCMRMLLNTDCKLIVSRVKYAHEEAIRRWVAKGRKVLILDSNLYSTPPPDGTPQTYRA